MDNKDKRDSSLSTKLESIDGVVNAEAITDADAIISDSKVVNKKTILSRATDMLSFVKEMMFSVDIEHKKNRFKVERELKSQVKKPVIFGALVLAGALGFFVLWGGVAPLDSAVVAEGTIIVSSEHRMIQHLEGGVIKEILVKDGDTVKVDQPLIILNDTQIKASVGMILSQLQFAKIVEQRLIAESQDMEHVDFSPSIIEGSDDMEVKVFMQNQESIFALNKASVKGAIDVETQKVMQKEAEIRGLQARMSTYEENLKIVKEQLSIVNGLQKQGLDTRVRLLDMMQKLDQFTGSIAEIHANMGRAREEIAEAELNKVRIVIDFKQRNAERFRENHSTVLDLEQKLSANRDILSRTVIRSPSSGMVTTLMYHTPGGVIQPGTKIMDIVPQDEDLIIEAYLLPQHVESIHPGLKMKVQLNAYKSRLVPRVDATLTYVSPDKIVTERGEQFYKLRAVLDHEVIKRINADIKLFPGMPVTVFVVKGERTVLQYLLSPIIDSFHRAFKEP
ncbi:putative AprE family type I secretion periplasmic adaptor subunit [Candidatus Cyrtobacter comes]|uniref:Membrane fusion protein (MFP) family protein n=1 Tax=Candidatus Cyrtobacter comes TaxID=675776 RepID=A0ABU5L7G6_9RICK|nr:HlyD family type I secretion periplasmic adaptor subunit [Candidatus Cyrtobacter comes]MDZ5762060.1 putative AprE family type I secretion periplasmic adaptor subunit [Candidatus Cyrtobacter comes]